MTNFNNNINRKLIGITGTGTVLVRASAPSITTPTIQSTGTDPGNNFVGYLVTANKASASAVSLTSGVAADVLTESISQGNFIVSGNVCITGSTTNLTSVNAWINTSSATQPATYAIYSATINPFEIVSLCVPFNFILDSGSSETVYLSVIANFASGTAKACGSIYARCFH